MTNALPPGPSESPFVQAAQFGQDPYAFLERQGRRFGSIFTIRLPGDAPRIALSEPALIRQVFALKPEQISAARAGFPVNFGERSMLLLDGEAHRRDRALIMPPLHGERLPGYARAMRDATTRALDALRPGEEVDLLPLLQGVTLDVILRCVFGVDDPVRLARIRAPVLGWLDRVSVPQVFAAGMMLGWGRVRRFLDAATADADAAARHPLRRHLPWNRAGRAKAEVMRWLRDDLLRCRAEGTAGRSDILAMLADARYEDGSPMDLDQAVDELVTLLVGGHETTANTLGWTFAHVLADPAVRARLRDEREAHFGDGRVDPTRTQGLAYHAACVEEAMRRTPIAPAIPRVLATSLELGGYTLPPDTILFPCTFLAHHREDLWDAPRAFRPERFVEAARVPADRFFPFGGGRRACIGMAFARLEMRVVLATVLERAELTLCRAALPRPVVRGMTVAPDAVRVTYAPRAARPTPRAAA